ncbi:hypothetical protein OAH81_01290 [Candidatus Pseudothioglobus singularis]|nr:hypothetical protein [Candidatus Pseudothioglobus singularis]MDB4821657.1 hypothetical protein [Candidatus Pseudothioglobus singularis]
MGFLKKWSKALTGGKKGIVSGHVMNSLDSLEEMLGKQRVLRFHRKHPYVLYHFCSSLATKLHAAYIGDGNSQGFLVAEEVLTSNGYGIPNEPKYHYDLNAQYESDVYSQDEIYDVFRVFGIEYEGTIDSNFIDQLATMYVIAMSQKNIKVGKLLRNNTVTVLANIVDPGLKSWDDSRVNIEELKRLM